MKAVLLTLGLMLSVNTAFAKDITEYIGRSGCDDVEVMDYYTDLKYFTNQNQVYVVVEMKDRSSDDGIPNETSFKTEAISSLVISGKTIVHQPSGKICARFVVVSPIGKKTAWQERGDCQVVTQETRSKTAAGKTCVRDYFLQVNN